MPVAAQFLYRTMFPFTNNLKIVDMRFTLMGQAVNDNAWTLFVAGLTIYAAFKVVAYLRLIHVRRVLLYSPLYHQMLNITLSL